MGARTFYHLPYYNAEIDLEQSGNMIDYALNELISRSRISTAHGILARRFLSRILIH